MQTAAAGLKLLSRIELVWETKVGEFDQAQLLKENDVFWLQVSVNHVKLVTVLDGMDNLEKKGKTLSAVSLSRLFIFDTPAARKKLELQPKISWKKLSLKTAFLRNSQEKNLNFANLSLKGEKTKTQQNQNLRFFAQNSQIPANFS